MCSLGGRNWSSVCSWDKRQSWSKLDRCFPHFPRPSSQMLSWTTDCTLHCTFLTYLSKRWFQNFRLIGSSPNVFEISSQFISPNTKLTKLFPGTQVFLHLLHIYLSRYFTFLRCLRLAFTRRMRGPSLGTLTSMNVVSVIPSGTMCRIN
jgi:hypothetical protein